MRRATAAAVPSGHPAQAYEAPGAVQQHDDLVRLVTLAYDVVAF
jgi:hypothetical protein